MSLNVGTIIVGGFSPEKEAVLEELGGQPASSAADPYLFFEQGKPLCMRSYLTHQVYNIYDCNVFCTYV
jgi:hypothetical protein